MHWIGRDNGPNLLGLRLGWRLDDRTTFQEPSAQPAAGSSGKLDASMFRSVPANANFPQLEEEILKFWKEHKIYEQSLERRAGSDKFVFYEGPPTANGMPHPGHCLTRAIKDLFPRYKTMRGFYCERKGGWDTHGLPVEVEVCKELGIHSKEEIEAFGIEPFIQKCQQSVWRYMQEWERLTERLGFWIHLRQSLCHLPSKLRRERVVVAEESVRPRLAISRTQDRLVVGARRHGLVERRSGTRLSRGGRSERVCEVPAARRCGREDRHVAAGLDDDAVDAAEQSVRGRPSGTRLTPQSSMAKRARS